MDENEYQDKAELYPFSHNAKSSVEIKLTTRGTTMRIKVVTGEEKLIDGLTDAAIKSYRKVQTELNIKEVKK